jgi:hypothetical protein
MDQTNTNKYNKKEINSSHDPNKRLRLLTNKLNKQQTSRKNVNLYRVFSSHKSITDVSIDLPLSHPTSSCDSPSTRTLPMHSRTTLTAFLPLRHPLSVTLHNATMFYIVATSLGLPNTRHEGNVTLRNVDNHLLVDKPWHPRRLEFQHWYSLSSTIMSRLFCVCVEQATVRSPRDCVGPSSAYIDYQVSYIHC